MNNASPLFPDKIAHNSRVPKFQQIADALKMNIESGVFHEHSKLPSIHQLSETYLTCRQTVERAYRQLRKEGYISHSRGKGFFLEKRDDLKVKVLLIFNNLSSFKKIIYYGILDTLKEMADVDLKIHHYNIKTLNGIIENSLGKYHYYAIMPHFSHDVNKEECLDVFRRIPSEQLIILDKEIENEIAVYGSVFQDFEKDIFSALEHTIDLLKKYKGLTIIFPGYSNHPLEILDGISRFCKLYKKEFNVIEGLLSQKIEPQMAYIVIEEEDLGDLIKKVRDTSYRLGEEVGIISFNESVLKELLGITVFSTDFEKMGRSVGEIIKSKKALQIRNPFKVIRRESL